MTHSVYFFDPDGNRLEIFSEVMDPEGRSDAHARRRQAHATGTTSQSPLSA